MCITLALMKVTLKTIAGVVGVSENTVSRALRGKKDIGEETAQRIRKVARSLGYSPNMAARSLAVNKSCMIGLVVTDMENPNRSELVKAIRDAAQCRGYHVLLSGVSYESEDQSKALEELIGRQVDGVVLGSLYGGVSELPVWPTLERIAGSGKPLVVFGYAHSRQLDTVNLDYCGAGRLLVNHLSRLGRKRIACVGAVGVTSEARNAREQGYCFGMVDCGLQDNISFIPCRPASLANGREDIKRYLSEANVLPDAIIAHNDLQAIGFIKGLKEAGLRVPDDIAVVGFDSIEMGEYTTPTLTSVGWPKRQIAEAITEMLFSRIDSKEPVEPEERVYAPEIVIRQSCGGGV